MSTAEQPGVSRGLLIALGVVVGLAVIAALWFFVVSPLLQDEPVAEPLPDTEEPGPTVEPEISPTPEPTPVPETEEFFTARDPFQQLVQAVAAAPAPDPDDDNDVDPDRDDDADRDPSPAIRVGATTVRLVDVVVGEDGVTRVQVEVNGEEYEAAENETFAERFRVLDITGECATFLFGDNRFTLCKGESIRK